MTQTVLVWVRVFAVNFVNYNDIIQVTPLTVNSFLLSPLTLFICTKRVVVNCELL